MDITINYKVMKSQPIKRSITLQPLSREHHHGLLLCWKIRTGLKKDVAIDRIKKYSDWFFTNSLSAHFNIEEEFIFPLLGNDHKLVKKALTDHRRLKRLFHNTTHIKKSLSLLEEELEKHIRFEERILFPAIEKVVTEKELTLIMEIHAENNTYEDWGDEFWK
jgi:iron-sulfur cluster repair protein YtfE (RIC family)